MKLETFSQYLMRKNETVIFSFIEIFKGKNGIFLCIDFQDDRPPIKIETYLTEYRAKQLINEIHSILNPILNATFYFKGWQTDIYFEPQQKTITIYFEDI